LPALAAAYGFGLAKNHGYMDGNKRIAYMAIFVFLHLNGLDLIASEPDAVVTMTDLASGELSEDELAAWIRANTRPLS
jgi:death-on-curing protein